MQTDTPATTRTGRLPASKTAADLQRELKRQLAVLHTQNDRLRRDNDRLRADVDRVTREAERMQKANADLARMVADFKTARLHPAPRGAAR